MTESRVKIEPHHPDKRLAFNCLADTRHTIEAEPGTQLDCSHALVHQILSHPFRLLIILHSDNSQADNRRIDKRMMLLIVILRSDINESCFCCCHNKYFQLKKPQCHFRFGKAMFLESKKRSLYICFPYASKVPNMT
ncbi:Hypothetical protein PYTT_1462 [Akkermansia glycaniphila]|uniref:Uncharacterized protein n=1 Tax=Akkermansia glycaniphila TaxID=1679444 RepID=A0A1H6LJG8_9BACT|nr:Hypothetical protein PYTT_1462 [Akkermansia glycaniphila]